MPSLKRPRELDTLPLLASHESPFVPMFQYFRNELDEHHDRRERIIKASRDVTAASKKIARRNGKFPPEIEREISSRHAQILTLWDSINPDLQGLNACRYARQISPGIQEFVEAVSFQHYIETTRLISYNETAKKLPEGVFLSVEDYTLGLFDLGGELMRFAITGLATTTARDPPCDNSNEQGKREEPSDALAGLRGLKTAMERLNFKGITDGGARDKEKKMEVLKQSLEKVEMAVYGMAVRGSERPVGWMPDLEIGGKGGEIEI